MLKIVPKLHAVICICLLTVPTAMADQAKSLTKEQSEKAVQLLNGTKQLLRYCATCSDKTSKLIHIESIESGADGYNDSWIIYMNGEAVDLAYSYYKENELWRNIAISLDIEVFEVPEYLTEEQISELSIEEVEYVDKRKKIEEEYSNCMDGLSGNSPMANCTYEALEAWDNELNRVYQELMEKHLNEKG